MTGHQLFEDFSQLPPQQTHVLLHYLADHVHEAQVGEPPRRVIDAIDFAEFLREVGDRFLDRAPLKLTLDA